MSLQTGGCAGGNDIVKKQNPLSLHRFRADDPVYAQHIGPALRLTRDAGLRAVVVNLAQRRHRLHSQFCPH